MLDVISHAIVGALAGAAAALVLVFLTRILKISLAASASRYINIAVFAVTFMALRSAGIPTLITEQFQNRTRVEKLLYERSRAILKHPRFNTVSKELSSRGIQHADIGSMMNAYGMERIEPSLIIERYQLWIKMIDRANDPRFCSSAFTGESYFAQHLMRNLELLTDEELKTWVDINLSAAVAYLDEAPKVEMSPEDIQEIFEHIASEIEPAQYLRLSQTISSPKDASEEDKCWSLHKLASLLKELKSPYNTRLAIALMKQEN